MLLYFSGGRLDATALRLASQPHGFRCTMSVQLVRLWACCKVSGIKYLCVLQAAHTKDSDDAGIDDGDGDDDRVHV